VISSPIEKSPGLPRTNSASPADPVGDFDALVRARLAEVLVFLLRGTLVLLAAIAAINTAAEGLRWAAMANIGIAAGGNVVLLWLVRRGRIELAVIGFICILFTLVFGSVYLRGTTRIAATSIVIPVAALAGLFLGRTALIASLCVCAVSLGGLTFAEAEGLLGPPSPGSLISFFAVLAALAVITGLVLYSARKIALQALASSRESLAHIAKINAELDQRVQERTAELRSAVDKLEEANRDLDSFNFSIAHDLRQPLNAIGGFADLLHEDIAGAMSVEAIEFAREIETNAHRMEQMIEALLRFSNVGRGTLNKVQVDMREQVDSVLRDLSVEVPLRAEVSVDDLPPAQGDEALLLHVWSNLIGNALKYSRKSAAPRVEISGVCRDGLVEYTVHDNGVGFDMREARQIFGVFQRLPSASGFEGSGVGLAIVERIVRRHGGQVRADSAPGEGATFRFTLPA